MRELLDRFTLDAIKFDYQVLAGMILIWLVVLACVVSSIFHQGGTRGRRIAWICVVTFVPIIGVLIYLPFSFRLENYPDLFIWRKSKGAQSKG
ncbi:MAG TPA: PLDc N-terminal domain-containing protein [Verrucomicrobiae bacterium]